MKMTELKWVALLCAFALALIHIVAHRLRFLQGVPRSRYLSFAGGAAVAYVFIHLLPELEAWQSTFQRLYGVQLSFLRHHLYFVALLGLLIFYGLERAVKLAQEEIPGDEGPPGVFWTHMFSFAVYNALIGYLLVHRNEYSLVSLVFFFIAMALFFFVNDSGMLHEHQQHYQQRGRWILAVAVVAGCVVGLVSRISESVLSILFAFIAGGTVLNVLKEELPEERQSNFLAFFSGAAIYSGLLIMTLE